jgi:hypothetical protein
VTVVILGSILHQLFLQKAVLAASVKMPLDLPQETAAYAHQEASVTLSISAAAAQMEMEPCKPVAAVVEVVELIV